MKKIPILLFAMLLSTYVVAQKQTERLIKAGYKKYNKGKYELAIEKFDAAIANDANASEAYYLKGICLSSLGQNNEALISLQKATAITPDYAEAYYEIGYIYLSGAEAELAIDAFDKCLKLNPEIAEAYVSRGTAHCMLEHVFMAMNDWQKAADLGIAVAAGLSCD